MDRWEYCSSVSFEKAVPPSTPWTSPSTFSLYEPNRLVGGIWKKSKEHIWKHFKILHFPQLATLGPTQLLQSRGQIAAFSPKMTAGISFSCLPHMRVALGGNTSEKLQNSIEPILPSYQLQDKHATIWWSNSTICTKEGNWRTVFLLATQACSFIGRYIGITSKFYRVHFPQLSMAGWAKVVQSGDQIAPVAPKKAADISFSCFPPKDVVLWKDTLDSLQNSTELIFPS